MDIAYLRKSALLGDLCSIQYLLSPFAHHLREYAAKLLSVNKKPAEAGFRVHLNATPEGAAGYPPAGRAASGS